MTVESPKAPEKPAQGSAPKEAAAPLDPAAQSALDKAAEAQEERLRLAQDAGEKPSSEKQPQASTPETTSAPSPDPNKPTPQAEKSFADKVVEHFEAGKAKGANWFTAGLSTLLFALSEGSGNLWDSLKNLFGGKKEKEEQPTTKPKDKPKDQEITGNKPEVVSKSVGYAENLKALMKEFNITENKSPKENFYLVATELAKEVEAKYGVPWQVCVAQACLESGYGTSGLTQNALNCFGIKKGDSSGPTYSVETTEYRNGVRGREIAEFRRYSSIRESFMDYGKKLSTSDHYKKAFDYKDDPKRFLQEVAKGGYATDPNYVAKVEGLLNSRNVALA